MLCTEHKRHITSDLLAPAPFLTGEHKCAGLFYCQLGYSRNPKSQNPPSLYGSGLGSAKSKVAWDLGGKSEAALKVMLVKGDERPGRGAGRVQFVTVLSFSISSSPSNHQPAEQQWLQVTSRRFTANSEMAARTLHNLPRAPFATPLQQLDVLASRSFTSPLQTLSYSASPTAVSGLIPIINSLFQASSCFCFPD